MVQVTDDVPATPHIFVVEATFGDGEQVYRDEGTFTIPTDNPTAVFINVALNLRREGPYLIALMSTVTRWRPSLSLGVVFKPA